MFISMKIKNWKTDKKHPAGVGVGRLPPCSARLLSKQRWRMSMVVKFPLRKSALLQFQTLAGYTISLRSDFTRVCEGREIEPKIAKHYCWILIKIAYLSSSVVLSRYEWFWADLLRFHRVRSLTDNSTVCSLFQNPRQTDNVKERRVPGNLRGEGPGAWHLALLGKISNERRAEGLTDAVVNYKWLQSQSNGQSNASYGDETYCEATGQRVTWNVRT